MEMPSDITDAEQKAEEIPETNETESLETEAFEINEKVQDGSADAPAHDDADDDARKLFVGGLSWETSEEDLKNYFSQWGNVTRCIIKLDRFTGNSRGFGFVTFDNEDSVNKVILVPEHKLKNKRIDPKRAKPSREVIKKIFVGGIDPELSKDEIMSYFGQFGQVESLDLPFDAQRGKRKHYIFVSFATEIAAKKAIAKDRQEIYGRQCDVRVAVTRDQANKNKRLMDPAYSYTNYAYGDYANAYQGLDPYAYGYYGYDCYGATTAAGAYGAYTGYPSNQFRGQLGAGKSNQLGGHTGYTNHGMGQSVVGNSTQPCLDHQGFTGLTSVNVSDLSGGAVQQQQQQPIHQ